MRLQPVKPVLLDSSKSRSSAECCCYEVHLPSAGKKYSVLAIQYCHMAAKSSFRTALASIPGNGHRFFVVSVIL